jgi:hypothetical protein
MIKLSNPHRGFHPFSVFEPPGDGVGDRFKQPAGPVTQFEPSFSGADG